MGFPPITEAGSKDALGFCRLLELRFMELHTLQY